MAEGEVSNEPLVSEREEPQPEKPQTTPTSSGATPTGPTKPPGPTSAAEEKAYATYREAESKVTSGTSFFGKIFGGISKLEDAAELYARAANQFKVAKNYEMAGRSFTEAAKLQLEKLDSRHEAANSYAEAAQTYKKANPQEAVSSYEQAIAIYTDMGRFGLAARYYNNVAEIYESDLLDFEKAIVAYEQAADFFKGEDSTASANKCMIKVGLMAAQLQQFEKAALLFEEIGKGCLDNGLLKYSAKDHFFKALVCWFCHNPKIVTDKLEEYKAIHPAFDTSRECKLIENLYEAYDDEDSDKFSEHIQEYDSISRIDNWLTQQLLHIKKSIDAGADTS